MSKVKTNTNETILAGKMVGHIEPYHVIKNEKYFKIELEVLRKSGDSDILPVVISEKLLDKDIEVGSFLEIEGQIRTYNKDDGGIETYLFAKDAFTAKEDTYKNIVKLDGHLCKKGIFRKTYSGRKIADFILAVNRAYGKSDYIPVLAWGKNARYVEKQEIPSRFELEGRFQSRHYCKINNDCKVDRVAYEISASIINTIN